MENKKITRKVLSNLDTKTLNQLVKVSYKRLKVKVDNLDELIETLPKSKKIEIAYSFGKLLK